MSKISSRLLLLLAVVLTLSGCARQTPESAYKTLLQHSKDGDWGYVYDNCDAKGQAKLDIFAGIMQKMVAISPLKPANAPKLDGLKGRDLYINVMKSIPQAGSPMIGQEFKSAVINGDKATITVVGIAGQDETKEMTLENGV